MLSIGNSLANSVWESQILRKRIRPTASSCSEEKQLWIRSKYEGKEFLPQFNVTPMEIGQQLIEAVNR